MRCIKVQWHHSPRYSSLWFQISPIVHSATASPWILSMNLKFVIQGPFKVPTSLQFPKETRISQALLHNDTPYKFSLKTSNFRRIHTCSPHQNPWNSPERQRGGSLQESGKASQACTPSGDRARPSSRPKQALTSPWPKQRASVEPKLPQRSANHVHVVVEATGKHSLKFHRHVVFTHFFFF